MKNTLSAIRNAHEKNSELKKMIVDHIDAYKNVSLALGADSTLKKILFIIVCPKFITVNTHRKRYVKITFFDIFQIFALFYC